jgi:hypothetical protein
MIVDPATVGDHALDQKAMRTFEGPRFGQAQAHDLKWIIGSGATNNTTARQRDGFHRR